MYFLCPETISEEKIVFLLFFQKYIRILSEIVWTFEKNIIMVGNPCFHVSWGFSERKNFQQFFFQIFFGIWEKIFQTFGVLLIGRAFKIAFFLPEELCDVEKVFSSEWDKYKKFLNSDREFFWFLAKNVSRDFRIHLFVPGWTFWEKPFVSQNFLLSWIFSDTGRKMFKTLSYFVRQGHRKSNLCVQRYFVTKNKKCFECFRERRFFSIIVQGLWSEKFALSKKKIFFLVLNTLKLYSTCPEEHFWRKFLNQKTLFFVKIDRTLSEHFSVFCLSCFR